MASPKIITVYGATGLQGGSVVESLTKDSSGAFKVRGITRNTNSEKSKSLANRGVEMIQANGLVYQQVVDALRGSWGVFANTNSEDPALGQPSGPSETDLGMIIVDAAVEAGVQHFVYSGMASASKTTNGAVPNWVFDEKNAIFEYAKTKGFKSVVSVSAGWYMENHLDEGLAPILGGFPFQTDEDGYYTLRIPGWGGNEEMPFISLADDYGDIVHGVFLQPEKYNGQLVQGISQSATATQLVETFERLTGKKSRFVPIEDWKAMETFGDRGTEATKRMFGLCQYSGGLYYGVPNDLTVTQELKASAVNAQGDGDSRLMTLERYLPKHFQCC